MGNQIKENIYPCLWFDGQAREAADFYCSIFPDSEVINDSGMVVNFQLDGKFFMGLNGGSNFKFNEAISFVIPCKDQEEIDHYWNKLISGGGEEGRCGWCKDKFGVSWQVIPVVLGELMSDPEKGQRVLQAFLKMRKFNIAELKNA